jgi:hypothetical protein
VKRQSPMAEVFADLEARAVEHERIAAVIRETAENLRRCVELGAFSVPGRLDGNTRTRGREFIPTRKFIPVGTKTGTKVRLAPGALGHRILEVLTEAKAPMKMGDLIEQVKARHWDVKRELSALRKAKRVVLVGSTHTAKWATPATAKGEAQ